MTRDGAALSNRESSGQGAVWMKSSLHLVTSIVCVAVVLTSAEQQRPVFRAGSDEVRVFTTVTDRNGRLVTTLKQEHFEVRDEGKPQPITLFDNTPQPIRLIVMLDVSGSMHGNLPLLRAAGTQLFSRLRADDAARVGSFGGEEIRMSRTFTRDPRELAAALPESIPKVATTPLWEALHHALEGFEGTEDAREVVLVLTDGKNNVSGSTPRDIIAQARRKDVMIYAVWMHSRSALPTPPAPGPGGLPTLAALQTDLPDADFLRIAEETGGGYIQIQVGQDLGAVFATVADELHTQYLIGFAPPERDGNVHDIDVRVTPGGMKARSRKSYVAPKG
jgi:Ca-activated chloride channel homolog